MDKEKEQMYLDAREFFYKQTAYSATYEELYSYLESKQYVLNKFRIAKIKYYDEKVLSIFNNLTGSKIKSAYFGFVENPSSIIHGIYDIDQDTAMNILQKSYPMHSEKISDHNIHLERERNKEEKKLNKIKEQEEQKRDEEEFHLTKSNYKWAVRGIIFSIGLAIIQIGISAYDIWCKDNKHETTMIQLDSIQVKQNERIIELMEKQNVNKDSVLKNN